METTPYIQKTFNVEEWNHYKDKEFFTALPTLISKDKSYKVTKYQRDHKNDCLWRTAKALEALFLTVITLGLALLIKQVFNLYLQAYFAKEIVAVKEPLTPKKNLLDLPKPIQNHIISFIPALEARKMLQVSKTTHQSSAEYFQSFDGILATFFELSNRLNDFHANPEEHPEKIPEYVIKFQECACQILKFPHIKENLFSDFQRKNKLLEYFIADFINWDFLDEELMKNLCTIFHENASDVQLKQFILKKVCRVVPEGYEIIPELRKLCEICAHTLNEQTIKKLDFNDEEVLNALVHLLSYWEPSQQRYQIIKELYEKMPKHPIWDFIMADKMVKKWGEDYQIRYLESEMMAIKVMKLLDDPMNQREKGIRICDLWNMLEHPERTVKPMMAIILQNFKLVYAHIVIFSLIDGNNFFETALEVQSFKQFKDLFEASIAYNIILNKSFEHMISSLKTQEHANALILTCKSLEEPERSGFLRYFAEAKDIFNLEKNVEQLIENAIHESEVSLNNLIPLDFEIVKKWSMCNYFADFNLKNFDQGLLRKFLNKKLNNYEEQKEVRVRGISLNKYLQALAAGVQVTDKLLIKSEVSMEDTKMIFDEFGYKFETFNRPISIEDFAKDITW